MANENLLFVISKEAAEDLSSTKYKVISQDSDGKIEAVAASTDHPFGILQNSPVTGEAASIAPVGCGGISKLEAGVTIATDAEVSFDADGNAAPALAGKYNIGICTKGGADGELIEVLLTPAIVKA